MKTWSSQIFKPISVIISLTMFACTTYTPPQTKLDIDWENEWQFTNFASSDQQLDYSQWWQNLNDQYFNKLLDYALENNRDVAASYAQIAVLRAQLASQDANLLPSVSGSTGAQRTMSEGQSPRNNFSLGVQASWDLDLWGQNQDGVRAAELGVGEQKLSFAHAKVSLASELARTYVNWRLAQARLHLNAQMTATRAQILQIAKWRKEAGLTSNIDVLQAQNAYEVMLNNRPNLLQNKNNLEIQLQLLMGGGKLARQLLADIPVDSIEKSPKMVSYSTQKPITTKKNLQATLTKPTQEALTSKSNQYGYIPQFNQSIIINAPADILYSRPDVAQKTLALKRQWLLWQQATKARLPNLKLSGSINNSELTFGKLFDLRSIVAQLAANLTAPIWDAGRIDSQVATQNAQFEVARLNYEKTILQAITDVESALVGQHYAKESLSQINKQLVIAEQLAKLSEQQYKAGLSDMTVLLTNLNSEQSAQENALSAKANVTLAGINLYKAVGGGWQNLDYQAQIKKNVSSKTVPALTTITDNQSQVHDDEHESIENLIRWTQQSD